jgi:hypothetical protein
MFALIAFKPGLSSLKGLVLRLWVELEHPCLRRLDAGTSRTGSSAKVTLCL